jgi:hypothetical protein
MKSNMTNLYEAGELLARVQSLVDRAGDKVVEQTPDGRDPVYWPYTIYGRSGMIRKDDLKPQFSNPPPLENKANVSQPDDTRTFEDNPMQ